MRSVRRRDLLGSLTAGAVALAGCASVTGDGGGSGSPTVQGGSIETGTRPPYASLLPALDERRVVFTAFDLVTEGDYRFRDLPETPTDPLRYNGAAGGVAASVIATFVLGMEPGFSPERFTLAEATHYVTVSGIGGIVMPVDVAGAVSDAKENDVEMHLDADDRAVFTGPGGDVVGVTADAFVFAPTSEADVEFDAVRRVRRVVDADVGAGERLHETDAAFDDLLRVGDTTGAVSGAYTAAGDLDGFLADRASAPDATAFRATTDGFGAARGAVFHLDGDNGDGPQPASAVVNYPDSAAFDADALTSNVGTAATDVAVVRDGATARVTGAYSWDDLGAFVETENGIGG